MNFDNSSSLTLIPCRAFPSPPKHATILWEAAGHRLELLSPCQGAAPSKDKDVLAQLVWKQSSSLRHARPCGMLEIPTRVTVL